MLPDTASRSMLTVNQLKLMTFWRSVPIEHRLQVENFINTGDKTQLRGLPRSIQMKAHARVKACDDLGSARIALKIAQLREQNGGEPLDAMQIKPGERSLITWFRSLTDHQREQMGKNRIRELVGEILTLTEPKPPLAIVKGQGKAKVEEAADQAEAAEGAKAKDSDTAATHHPDQLTDRAVKWYSGLTRREKKMWDSEPLNGIFIKLAAMPENELRNLQALLKKASGQ